MNLRRQAKGLSISLLVALSAAAAFSPVAEERATRAAQALCGPRDVHHRSSPAFAFTFDRSTNPDEPGPFTLYVASVEGSRVWRIGRDLGGAWAPLDGGRLATATYRDIRIWSGLAVLGLRHRCQQLVGGTNANSPAWTPNGKRIAFEDARNEPAVHIYVADEKGGVRKIGQPYSQVPAWSPDRRRLAYVVSNNGRAELWVMNADGTGQRSVARMDHYCQPPQPQWLRDNNRVVFCGADSRLSIVALHTRSVRAIWKTFSSDSFSRSPMTNQIAAIATPDRGAGLYLVDPLSRRRPRPLVPGRVSSGPTWSHDGRNILFGKNGQIWMINPNGLRLRQLTHCARHGGCDWPEWLAQQPSGFPRVTWRHVN